MEQVLQIVAIIAMFIIVPRWLWSKKAEHHDEE